MTIAAVLIFSLIDYAGYNLWGKLYENNNINAYRVFALLVQAALCAVLCYMSSVMAAVAFMLFWWVGVCDLLYYTIDALTWDFDEFFYASEKHEMSWLWFTPIGIVKKILWKKNVTKIEFLMQTWIGTVVIIIIEIILL